MRKEYPEEVGVTEDNNFPQSQSEPIALTTRKCLSRLSTSERSVIERIYSRKQHRPMLDILAQVLQHHSLQPGFTVGNMNRLLRMKSPDELAHYLRHILDTWTYIMGAGNIGDLDPNSVELLQGRSPVWSTNDHEYISRLLRSGSLMPRVTNKERRKALGRRLLSIRRIIPSMYTFMEDTKLIPDGPRDTIRTSLWHQFRPRRRSRHSNHSGFLQAYRRLWLYTMQYFPVLVGTMPLLDHRGAERSIYRSQEESQRRWVTFSRLAISLGFDSPQIRGLLHLGVAATSEPHTQSVSETPCMTQPEIGHWKMHSRCGMPSESSFLSSRRFLTLDGVDREVDYNRGNSTHQPLLLTSPLTSPPPGTAYSASVYETTTALSSRRQSPAPLTTMVEMTQYRNLNPFNYSSDSSTKSLSSTRSLNMSLEYEQPALGLGLLGKKTIQEPQDFEAPLKTLSGDKGILYEIGNPATVFYLPLARVDRLFAQYSQSHQSHRYAILIQGELCPVHPTAVPTHLRSTVVITGPNLT
ncbi:hypothetical protein BDV38DRAFT_275347 [Aspergillus pseudotamarii]|uniref:Uncharacterized protein n=1 Tax=Aspergillus pseudotamarii TaxID=132259 RepID=A0A5N6SE83_ASPPS|nr:uncharacterized protein BDV38DRAFT_275347 [Aspergillus pseudotamarii]KAE8132159.1 hypothetical protein BDV38DRAFT_275347 [Aspergillus pseudotamarii]